MNKSDSCWIEEAQAILKSGEKLIPRGARLDAVAALNTLPDDIFTKAYNLELISKRVQIQHDSWLKDKYKEYRIATGDEDYDKDFLEYRINGWRIVMEAE